MYTLSSRSRRRLPSSTFSEGTAKNSSQVSSFSVLSSPASETLLARNFESTPVAPTTHSDFEPIPRSEGGNLDPTMRAFLEPRFGHSLENIRIFSDAQADRLSQGFDAAAFTVGQNIFFAQGNYDPDSTRGRRLLTHEVAHAVQQRGVRAGADDLDRVEVAGRHSRSESEAHAATDAVIRGNAVNLSASPGPMINRWESGEHKKAVDEALTNLGPNQQIDPEVAKMLTNKIKLANGLEVTPGQITAMMGDFYGRFKEGDFDPEESFKQLNNADPKEMAQLIKVIDEEAKTGKAADASELEKITRHRSGDDGSYLELAKKNKSHFSAPNAEGTNNNMGAYSAFHDMALKAAQEGDMERAKALEASGNHFLTDRFAAGHNFDKDAVMKAADLGEGVLGQGAVRTVHDDLNNNGTTASDAAGQSWRAYGDGNWERKENEENRKRTAGAVYGSWNELAQVASGGASPKSTADSGYSALGAVPQWDQQREEGAEALARNNSVLDILWANASDLPDAVAGSLWRTEGKIENAASAAWDWGSGKAKEMAAGIGGAYNDATGWLGDKAQEIGSGLGGAYKDATGWLGNTAGELSGGLGGAYDQASGWFGNKGSEISSGVGGFFDEASQWRSLDDVTSGLGNAVSDMSGWAGRTGEQALAGVTGSFEDATGWLGKTGDQALSGIGGAYNDATGWLGNAGGQAINGIGGAVNEAVDWTMGVGQEIGAGVEKAGDWLKSLF